MWTSKKRPTIFLNKTALSLYISIQTLECLTYKVATLTETAIRPLEDKKFVHKRLFKLSQEFIYSIQISKKNGLMPTGKLYFAIPFVGYIFRYRSHLSKI